MKYTGPKVRLSRRLGIPITPKAARVLENKPYAPGQHGQTQSRFQKMSDYKRQLIEKQKLRSQYNIHERQLVNYYKKASRKTGNTSENLIQLLEARLDALVARSGLARTIYAARQLVSHGHILVNGKRVNVPAYQLKVDDEVTVRAKSRKMEDLHLAMRAARRPPAYISLLKPEFSAKLLDLPARADVPVICDLALVTEFYSR